MLSLTGFTAKFTLKVPNKEKSSIFSNKEKHLLFWRMPHKSEADEFWSPAHFFFF